MSLKSITSRMFIMFKKSYACLFALLSFNSCIYSYNYNDTARPRPNHLDLYIASFVIGILHGALNKLSEHIDYRAQQDSNFKKDKTFRFLTFVSTHLARLHLLNNKNVVDLDIKNIASAWWHGFGQTLIETYDVRKGDFVTSSKMNATLVLAMIACGAYAAIQEIPGNEACIKLS
jgi:hypothetical protein